jgi:hypothetical protein
MMKKTIFVSGVLLLTLSFLLLRRSEFNVEAAEIRQHLESAITQIETAQPGQIVYVTETSYRRPPPEYLEPSDPYHLPYSQIWADEQHIERWIQFDADNVITRWRNQVRDANGRITQELLYVHGVETNYFPQEGWATQFDQEASQYRDGRIALIEDFLAKDDLRRRINTTSGERSVLSIYGGSQYFEATDWDIEAGLLFFNSPFLADIAPISRTLRIDFDQETWMPVGQGVSVWDQEGQEHIATYVTLVRHEFLPATEAETIFHVEIPETAFADAFPTSSGTRSINNLSGIITFADYPIYGIQDPHSNFRLRSASLAIFDASQRSPTTLPGLLALEIGVELTYMTGENVLVIRQGPKEEMGSALRQLRPSWTLAERVMIKLGKETVPAWLLSTGSAPNVAYMVETNEVLLYIRGEDVEPELMLSFMEELMVFE